MKRENIYVYRSTHSLKLQNAPQKIHKKHKIRSKDMGKEKKPQMLPPPPLFWSWSDDDPKIPSKANRMFHDSIKKNDKRIHVGDCAIFLSPGQHDLPYIGQIDCMWQTPAGKMKVKVKWFYHSVEVEGAGVGGGSRVLLQSL